MATIKLRTGTTALWIKANPVLALGEPGYDSDTHVLKVGDGSTPWTSLKGYLYEATLAANYAAKAGGNRIAGFNNFGAFGTDASVRNPLASTQILSSGGAGTADHVAHLFQTVVSTDWSADTGLDPGFAWGTNFFTTTGTNAGDANGVAALYGGLIEADVRAPAGSAIGTVIGLQAEAAFAGAASAAAVTRMISLQVTAPKRKDAATAGTATTSYGLLVKQVDAAAVGATTAYSLFVEGGESLFNSTITVQTPGSGSGSPADSLTLKSSASQTGNLLRLRDSAGSSVGRITTGGILAMFGRGVFKESVSSQVSLGDVHPSDLTKAAVAFGTASDVVLFRPSAGVLALKDQQVFTTGKGPTSSRPSAATVGSGAMYYDTTMSKPIFSDGSIWKDAVGTAV